MSVSRARALRKTLTPFEARVWLALKQLRPQGLHFRRQAPVDGYILDFVCLRAWLIVELDGDQHGREKQAARDRIRDAHFEAKGFHVLRFWNNEVVDEFDGVIDTIFAVAVQRKAEFDQRLCVTPPSPSPQGGEGNDRQR
jgi:very-short-patch-repair endonuclease